MLIMTKGTLSLALLCSLMACTNAPRRDSTRELINQQMREAAEQRERAPVPASLGQALIAPADPAALGSASRAPERAPERRFNLAVSNAPVAQVFAALAADSQYSIVVHPDVVGNLTVNLRDVTMREALETIREVYGYEFVTRGNLITVSPLALQSRQFQINYLTGSRTGRSDTRVVSGSILSTGSASAGGGGTQASSEGASVQTNNKTDLWVELNEALRAIVGEGAGRSVVMSPQSGVVLVRAMPNELREVENFLRMSRLSLERQVVLEAKIVEVVLNDAFQHGINWMALAGNRNMIGGSGVDARQVFVPSGPIGSAGQIGTIYDQASSTTNPNTLGNVLATPIVGSINGAIGNSPLSTVLGLTFTTNNFNAILSFLETQGGIQVMSSPRIATLNNQKAVLKVGSDDYFVTKVTTTASQSGGSSLVSPTIDMQAFFSGISLDVTPQIDEFDNVMLHIRPSVSVVTERTKSINLGTAGVFNLPVASSRTNETDSIVRVREGNIAAIGGLMEQVQTNDEASVPGVGKLPVLSALFSQGKRAQQKRELVVLLKATIVRNDQAWEQGVNESAERISRMRNEPQHDIRMGRE